jgi:hypothetical protein
VPGAAAGRHAFGDIRVNGGLQFMTETQTKDAKIFTWVVGALMVILLCYGLLTIIGVVR